jgi:photosystem II stability/assembly factor-like uncharacterized protein
VGAVPRATVHPRLGRPQSDPREKRRLNRRAVVPAAIVAVLIGIVATAGLVSLRGSQLPGSTPPATSTTQATAQGTSQRTELVARLPLNGQFSWAPDGEHLLVASQSGSVVYDRSGNLVTGYGQFEGWLDSTHLISGNGHVAGIDQSYTGGPTSNSWVVASGHGSAAIIVAVPGCTGDPIIDWYKNGGYVRAQQKATPFGWSPDGKLALLGHLDCSSQDAELNGWKGPVDIVDSATGGVLATAPAVRGEMAFNPSGTRLAAESDNDLEIVDIATGQVKTVPGAHLLGWSDDDRVYCQTAAGSLALVGATAKINDFGGIVVNWAVPSPAGPTVEVDKAGRPLRIAGANIKKTLLDLSAMSLQAARESTAGQRTSELRQSAWSPDGSMLALESADGASLALFSVTDLPGDTITSASPSIGASPAGYLPGPVTLSGSSAWMVLDSGVSVSSDGGRSWVTMPLPSGVSSAEVAAVATAPARPVWLAVASQGGYRLFRADLGSSAWSSVQLTPSWGSQAWSDTADMVRISPGPGGLVTVAETMSGGNSTALTSLFVSNDDGKSFVQHPPRFGRLANTYWGSVLFTTPESGLVIAGPDTYPHVFFYTSDSGATWSESVVPGLPAAGDYTPGEPLLVGSDIFVPVTLCGADCGTTTFSLLVSHDGGATFSALEPQPGPLHNASPAVAALGQEMWVSSGAGTIYESADGGQTWTSVTATGLPIGATAIALTGPASATAVIGESGCNGFKTDCWSRSYLMATTDGGRTWSRI